MNIVQFDPYLRLIPKARMADLCRSILSEFPDPGPEPSMKRQKTEFKLSPAGLKVLREAAEAGNLVLLSSTVASVLHVFQVMLSLIGEEFN